jgi:5,10-methylenetetrahydromethanopterin reductase
MRIGLVVPNQRATVPRVSTDLARAEKLGYDSAWMPGIPNGPDVLTLLAAAGPAAGSLELGPAVVPTYLRHPVALASQALTVNDAMCGRLTLGIGVSHRRVTEGLLGVDSSRPLAHMEDYLQILVPLLQDQRVDYEGPALRTRFRLEVSHSDHAGPAVFIAALGPRMLALAGRLATGAATWMVGVRTLAELTVPTVRDAAARAGRPEPRVFASLPFLLTDDPDIARSRAAEEFGFYGRLPAYRAMLHREGVTSAAELAVAGDEAHLAGAVQRIRDAGVTDLQITPFGDDDERLRTIEFMATLR